MVNGCCSNVALTSCAGWVTNLKGCATLLWCPDTILDVFETKHTTANFLDLKQTVVISLLETFMDVDAKET